MTSGGFLGVDIFFVISGYVMYLTVSNKQTFGFRDITPFFKKRLFRIYPVLLATLFLSAICAGLVMNTSAYDNFGKQLFFAALSLSNLHFAQGLDYFNHQSVPILLHTWSLGVEMQFYVLFPLAIILLNYAQKYKTALLICAIGFTTAWMLHTSGQSASFYLLQNRAFEFLIGMLSAQYVSPHTKHLRTVSILVLIGLFLCLILFSEESHPNLYTILPVLLSAVFLNLGYYASHRGVTINTLSYIGRLSYGIYLFHFPVIYFTEHMFGHNPLILLSANIVLTMPLAALSYRYFETPIRRIGYSSSLKSYGLAFVIALCALILAGSGFLIAKKQGLPERLRYFNPYGYSVSQTHTPSKEMYIRGYDVKSHTKAKILFIGDSLLQQYIDPITDVLGLSSDHIDSVTRGGCLLLKNVEFEDKFADISCDELRTKLYTLKRHYDYIVISQNWEDYRTTLLNADPTLLEATDVQYIMPFLRDTLEHFAPHSDQIIVLGVHPRFSYDKKLEIGPTFTKQDYQNFITSLALVPEHIKENKTLFSELNSKKIQVIHPVDLLCGRDAQNCMTQDAGWSYYNDSQHLTKPGQNFAEQQLKAIFP